MSAYVVNDVVIDCLADGIFTYGVVFKSGDYKQPRGFIINKDMLCTAIGQSLVNYNYKAVNYRYKENTEPHEYGYQQVNYNVGELYDSIDEYLYQVSELDDYDSSDIYYSLLRLKDTIVRNLIHERGFEINNMNLSRR